MLKNDVGSTSHINVEPMLMQRLFNVESMLMQGSINVEFSVSSTAILLAWYSVIQAYFMVGNSLQLCWQKDTKKETWFSDNITRTSDKKMATMKMNQVS